MDAAEVRRVRVSRGWTVEEMADAVHASPLEVAAWEAGTIGLPEEQEAWIRWLAASDDWCAGVVAAGLPGCAWVREHAPDLHERILYDRSGNWAVERDDVSVHYASCGACRSVGQLAQRLSPPPEPPGDDFHTVQARYGRWVKRLPGWLRYPVQVAVWVGIVLCLGTIPEPDSGWRATAAGLLLGAVAGTSLFVAVRAKFDAASSRHPFLGGMLAGAAGVGAGLLTWNAFDAALPMTNARVLAAAGLMAVTLGLLEGFRARRSVRPGAAHDAGRWEAALAAAPASGAALLGTGAAADGPQGLDARNPAEPVPASGRKATPA